MKHSLANFKGEEINKLTTPEGDKIEFSLQSYFDLHKLTRVRLYFKTERKAPTTSKEEARVGHCVEDHALRGKSSLKAYSLIAQKRRQKKKC